MCRVRARSIAPYMRQAVVGSLLTSITAQRFIFCLRQSVVALAQVYIAVSGNGLLRKPMRKLHAMRNGGGFRSDGSGAEHVIVDTAVNSRYGSVQLKPLIRRQGN